MHLELMPVYSLVPGYIAAKMVSVGDSFRRSVHVYCLVAQEGQKIVQYPLSKKQHDQHQSLVALTLQRCVLFFCHRDEKVRGYIHGFLGYIAHKAVFLVRHCHIYLHVRIEF